MCAIAGIIGPKINKINNMIDIQSYRGPDDKKTFIDKNVAIGMARLSILDLKSEGLCLYKEKNLSVFKEIKKKIQTSVPCILW